MIKREYIGYTSAQLTELLTNPDDFINLPKERVLDYYLQRFITSYKENNYYSPFIYGTSTDKQRAFKDKSHEISAISNRYTLKLNNILRSISSNKLKQYDREYLILNAYIAIYFRVNHPFDDKKNSKQLTEYLINSNSLSVLKSMNPLFAESFITMQVGIIFTKCFLILEDHEAYQGHLKALYYYCGMFVERFKIVGIDSDDPSYLIQPYKMYTQNIKNRAIPLAKKIWSYDADNILLRKQVANLIVKLLPDEKLTTTQVDNWLKESDIVPKAILDIYKKNLAGQYNSQEIKDKRKELEKKILKELSYVESDI